MKLSILSAAALAAGAMAADIFFYSTTGCDDNTADLDLQTPAIDQCLNLDPAVTFQGVAVLTCDGGDFQCICFVFEGSNCSGQSKELVITDDESQICQNISGFSQVSSVTCRVSIQ